MAALHAEGRYTEGGLRPQGLIGGRRPAALARDARQRPKGRRPAEGRRFRGRPARDRMQTHIAVAFALVTAATVLMAEPAQLDARLQAQLRRLFPQAASFSAKGGEPPHFKALDGQRAVTGYAFWTTELEPLERGYDGPIKILVGLDLGGVLTGIIVAAHNEPYGNFSIDMPRYPEQFRGKSVRDPFRVGGDIDAVSRATMTVSSATRAVRNSARRVARQLLTPPGL
jgi:transcriptional regulator of nitric oxide reductase